MQDIAWVESHSLEFPELRIELQPQRFYPHGTQLWPTFSVTSARSARSSLRVEEYKDKGLSPRRHHRQGRARAVLRRISSRQARLSKGDRRQPRPCPERDRTSSSRRPARTWSRPSISICSSRPSRSLPKSVDQTRDDHRDGPEQRRDLRNGVRCRRSIRIFLSRAARRPKDESRSRILAGRKASALQSRHPGTLSAGLDLEDTRNRSPHCSRV